MSISEKRVESALVSAVKRAGGLAIKLTSPGYAGIPDRLVLLPGGRALFAELKRPGGEPRPLQRKRAEQLEALGFRVLIIDGLEAVQEALNL